MNAVELEVRGLEVCRAGKQLLAGLSFSVNEREIIGVIGPAGAGKSLLQKTVAALVLPTAGEVLHRGVLVDWRGELTAWRRSIGMSFQNDALFDSLTVFENVAFPLRRRRLCDAEIVPRVTTRLAEVGLALAANEMPSHLSGGMKKRVGIARATVIEPQIGLFDDPFAGLDPLTGSRIRDLIVAETERLRMATIIVSNDLDLLLPVCRQVVMLVRGQAVYTGSSHGLLASERPEVVQFVTGSDVGPL